MSIANTPLANVFAYGTLMFPAVWRAVTGRDERGIPARLAGHAVFCVRDAVYPGMVWTGGFSTVPGIVYRNVDAVAVERLDDFEGDLYERRVVSAVSADGTAHECFAYVIPAHHQRLLTTEPWTAERFAVRGDLARFLSHYRGFRRLLGHQHNLI